MDELKQHRLNAIALGTVRMLNSGISAQRHGAAWMGGEWIHVYVWLSPSAVYLKLSQHRQSAVLQYKIKSFSKRGCSINVLTIQFSFPSPTPLCFLIVKKKWGSFYVSFQPQIILVNAWG